MRGTGRRGPAQRPRGGDRRPGHRAAVEESPADRRMAQGSPRDRAGEDQQADLHRRPAPHRDHDPVRPTRPGPAAAPTADLGGRQPVSAAAARDLRQRPAHRRNPGPPRDERADHSRLHEVPPDGSTGRSGVRADHRRPVLQHDLLRSVPPTHLLQVAAVRGRPSSVLSLSPNLPAALAIRCRRPVAAEVARASLDTRHPGGNLSRRGDRADAPRPA